MKRLLGTLIPVLLAVAYMAGYWPQRNRLQRVESQLRVVSAQLANSEAQLRIHRLRGLLLDLMEKVSDKNFGDAQKLSSAFFDQVRAETTQNWRSEQKAVLESVLRKRDSVTAGLAKGDSATLATLQQALAELRQLLAAEAAASSGP